MVVALCYTAQKKADVERSTFLQPTMKNIRVTLQFIQGFILANMMEAIVVILLFVSTYVNGGVKDELCRQGDKKVSNHLGSGQVVFILKY